VETDKQRATASSPLTFEQRAKPRFKMEVEILINSRSAGRLKGHTVDISESGISAILRLEVPLGEVVELEFTLPFGPVIIYAVVRQRSAFRFGFQFAEANAAHNIIRATCQHLAVAQIISDRVQKHQERDGG
jgi:hypothetical protein